MSVNSAHGQPYAVFEGTTIDTVLVNRLDGEFAGPVKVMVTNPVYSQDRQHLLIPEGTFILGDVQKVSGFGQKRLAVTFHRLLMPDGYSVDLDLFHGLDQAGATGLKDKVNNHYVEIFGASIALGIVAVPPRHELQLRVQPIGKRSLQVRYRFEPLAVQRKRTRPLHQYPTDDHDPGRPSHQGLHHQDMLLPAVENHTVPSNI